MQVCKYANEDAGTAGTAGVEMTGNFVGHALGSTV